MSEYTGAPPSTDQNEVTLVIDGARFTGWKDVEVTRGVQITPGHFSIAMTDPDDVTKDVLTGAPDKDFQLLIGGDTVISGVIDKYTAFFRAGARGVRIHGRSHCRELVDCSIDETTIPGMQISGGTLASIASQVAAPYGIAVVSKSAGKRLTIPQMNLNLGESPYSLIERIARYQAIMVHDDELGALVLDSIGSTKMASGAVEGVNVQAAEIGFAADIRYSDVVVYQVSSWSNFDVSGLPPPAVAQDPGVKRKRRLVLMSEQTYPGNDMAQQRANWEVVHRYGQSMALSVSLDNWRDSSAALWRPNALMSIDVPHCRLTGKTWVIAQVSFVRGEGGQRADLTLMPQEAFQIEPTQLLPFDAETYAALQRGQAGGSGSLQYAPGRDPANPANYNPRRGDAAGV